MNMQQECVCCGETFKLMSDLFEHMREAHTEAEVLAALAEKENNAEASS